MRGIAVSVVVLAVSWAAEATAQTEAASPASDPIERAQELARAFELEQAIATLATVVDDDGESLTRRLEALTLTARFQVDLQQQAAARETFGRLLRLDPGHELSQREFTPEVRALYEQSREDLPAAERPRVEVTSDEQVTDAGEVAVSASLSGDTGSVHSAQASYRGAGETAYRRAAMDADEAGFRVTLVPPEDAEALEYYLEVQAPSGYALGAVGSADSPLTVALERAAGPGGGPGPDRQGPRWYASWWFWTIVGVVVAGGATAGIVVATLPGPDEQGSFATIHLP